MLTKMIIDWMTRRENALVESEIEYLSKEEDATKMLIKLISDHSGIDESRLNPDMRLDTDLGVAPVHAFEMLDSIANVVSIDVSDREVRKAQILQDLVEIVS